MPHDTDALIVELGANDMLRGLDPAGAKAALATILGTRAAAHIPTLLTGMRAAPNLGPDYQARFDAIYPDLANQFGVALYPFFLEGVAADPKLNQKDGLHPTREGVERIVDAMLPAVEALLKRVGEYIVPGSVASHPSTGSGRRPDGLFDAIADFEPRDQVRKLVRLL